VFLFGGSDGPVSRYKEREKNKLREEAKKVYPETTKDA